MLTNQQGRLFRIERPEPRRAPGLIQCASPAVRSGMSHDRRGTATLAAVTLLICFGTRQLVQAADESIVVPQVTMGIVREAKIPAADSGTIAKMIAVRGQTLKKGDLIATLENRQQILNLEAAQLNLRVATVRAEDRSAIETATAQLQEARSGRRVKEIALQIAETEAESDALVQIASAQTRLLQLELSRAQGARQSFRGSISESQIDRLQTSVEKGELEIRQAQEDQTVRKLKPQAEQAAVQQKDDEIRRYQSLVTQGEKDLQVAELTRDVRANDVKAAEWNLERRNIRAPFDGVVVDLSFEAGEWIEQGTVMARIISLSTLSAEGRLPVAQAVSVDVGRPVTINIVSGKKTKPIKGRVTFVSPEVDPVSQKVRFRAEFDNSDAALLPGMKGSLTIESAP